MTVMSPPLHHEIILMAVRDGVQVASFARRLLRRRQLLAGHLFVNFLDVRERGTLGVAGDARVGFERVLDLFDRIAHLLGRLFGFDELAHLFAQRAEIFLLIVERRFNPALAVPRTNDLRAQLLGLLERGDPFFDMAVADEIVRAVHAGVAGEEYFLFRQPGERVAVSMRDAQVPQLHPSLAVIEDHFAREEHRGRFELTAANIRAFFGRIFPSSGRAAVIAGLVFFHLVYHAGVRHGHGAVFDPVLLPLALITVMLLSYADTSRSTCN